MMTEPAEEPRGGEGPREVIVKYNGDLSRLEAALGAEVEPLGADYAIVTMDPARFEELYLFPEVEYIEQPKLLSLSQVNSLGAVCVTGARDAYQLTGQGTLVAVLDSGLDYRHGDFRREDGSTRVLWLWDQTLPGRPPPGFKGGAEFSGAELDQALSSGDPYGLVSHRDTVGHGTAVAGIAAGNGRESGGGARGVAPEADLLAVKLGERGRASFARTTELMRALKYVTDKALELRRPLAVNISYGSNDGAHNGSTLFENYIDELALTWKTVIVAAAGNEGGAGHHFAAHVGQGETLDVPFAVSANLPTLTMSIWRNFADDFTFALSAPNGAQVALITRNIVSAPAGVGNTTVTVSYRQPTHYSVGQEVFFAFRADTGPGVVPGIWTLRITGTQVVDGQLDVWLPTVEEVSAETAFFRPSAAVTLTIPATAGRVVTVGGYDAARGSIAPFSGQGSLRDGADSKPDLVAPAVDVSSARAGGGYDVFTGTSMAAPFVTGAAALMMEWGVVQGNDPFLYGQRVKAFLRRGAARDLGQTYPNPSWGYGKLCLKTSLDTLQTYSQF